MTKTKQKILDLPQSRRPVERMLLFGKENLSDAELTAILLATGTVKHNALNLARRLLKEIPLRKLPCVLASDLRKFAGIGKIKAARLLAAVEIGNRIRPEKHHAKIVIRKTGQILPLVSEMAAKKQEVLTAFYLNGRDELVARETVGIGSLNKAVMEPRDILAPALSLPCAKIIVVHNHPSGDPTPSEDDVKFTVRLKKAAEIMGIKLADHLIISQSRHFSFREEKLI